MTNEEINKYIHIEILGLETGLYMRPMAKGGETFDMAPDYCSDDSPRSLLNEVVAKVRVLVRAKHVRYGFFTHMTHEFGGPAIGLIAMTAEQIARACVTAHKLSTKPLDSNAKCSIA